MYTRGQKDPDFILRPSGEKRLSNFMLWQAAYSEMVEMDVLWPDFTREDLDVAIWNSVTAAVVSAASDCGKRGRISLKTRIITSIVGLAVLAVVLSLFNTAVFEVVVALICLVAVHEIYEAFDFGKHGTWVLAAFRFIRW